MAIFDNCIIQAPDGTPLTRCGMKKAKWYLRRNLGEVVSQNPMVIKLLFEPSGRSGVEDTMMLAGKPNHCVVCGCAENLTRHHVIPSSFIKHMDLKYKVDIIRDILPLCRTCHDDYEQKSQELRNQIVSRLGMSITEIEKSRIYSSKCIASANALINYGENIPQERKEKLLNSIKTMLCKSDISKIDLESIAKGSKDENDHLSYSEWVAKSIKDYDEFAKEWRTHFVETMQPKYLPDTWAVDRKVGKVWIPARMIREHEKKKNQADSDGEN